MTLHVTAQALGAFRHLRRSPRLHSVRHEIHGTERQGGRATGCLPDLWHQSTLHE